MQSDLLVLNAALRIDAAADPTGDKPARISGTAYGGGLLPLNGALFVLDLSGASLPDSVPLLAGHSTDQLENIAGQVSPRVSAGKILIEGTVSRGSASGRTAIALAKDSVLLQCSVGYQPTQTEVLPPGEVLTLNGRTIQSKQTVYVVRKGILKEVSLVGVGADSENQVSIAASAQRKTKMSTDNQNVNASAEQLERIEAHWNAAARSPWYTDSDVYRGGDSPFARAQKSYLAASRGMMTQTEFEAKLWFEKNNDSELRRLHAERPKGPVIRSSSRDADSGSSDVLQAAFCRTIGLQNATLEKHFTSQILEASDKLRSFGIQELLLQAAHQNGYSGRNKVSAGNLGEVLRAGWSTNDISGILSNATGKAVAESFSNVEMTWKTIARIRPVSDFKASTSYRLTDSLEYEELGNAGEIKHGTLGEESWTVTAKTFARMLSLTRQDIINDDLGVLSTIPRQLGRGAGLAINKAIWTAFLAASAGGTFWTGGRGNLVTTNALTIAGLTAGVAAFRAMTDSEGYPLGILPKTLLCPIELEGTAKSLNVSTEIRNTTTTIEYTTANPHVGQYTPAASAYLSNSLFTGFSASTWFLAADPQVCPVMEIGFLDGREAPTVESADADFNTLGIQFRGYHDFGVAMAEWRGSVKNTT